MSYKNLQHYRYTVHRYLDAIWVLGTHKGKARTSMYSLLSRRMNIPMEETHIKFFNRAQCKEAIKILRPMYIQLYGSDLPYKKKEKEKVVQKMYYSQKSMTIYVSYNKKDKRRLGVAWSITIYCKSSTLENGKVYDFIKTEAELISLLGTDDLDKKFEFEVTLENVAKYIWEQIIPCYKVKIETSNNEVVIYEEEKI